jgi:hypothetical protein
MMPAKGEHGRLIKERKQTMTNANTFSRRGFLEAVAALSSLGVAACAAVPQQTEKLPDADRKTRKLPPRGEFVVRNAYLVTMDARLGDIPVGDADRTDATGKSF